MEDIVQPPKLLDVAVGIISKPLMDYTTDDQQILAQQYMIIGLEKAKIKYKTTQIKQELDDYTKTQTLLLKAELETVVDAKGNEKEKNKYTELEVKSIVDTDIKTVEYKKEMSLRDYESDTLQTVMNTIQMVQPIARETIGVTGFMQ